MVQGNDWSNVGKLIFKSSIHLLGSGQRLIECWKAHFQEFDSFSWFRATTDRMLESSFSRVRFVFLFRATTDRMLESSFSRVRFVYLVQGKDWSNVGKLIFKSSIRFLGSGQRLIECWKAHFQEFDSFSWFRATTDRMLESSFSRVRFVFLVQGKDWSNVGKLIFKSSIRFLGSGQGLIECWKARFQEFDSFSWFRARTDRMLESSFSRVRFVFLVQGKDWSNVGKLVFKSSISLQWFRATTDRMLERSFSRVRFVFLFRATTDRMLESSFSRVRFVYLVQGNDWSNVGKLVFKSSISLLSVVALNQVNESNSWKRAFQHSISRCPEQSKLIELLKTSFPTFDQSLPWTKKTNRTLENELSNIWWFRATTDRMLESSFSRVRFVFLVQGNNWSNVGKLVFKSLIRFLVQGNDWSNVGKLIFKSSIRLLGSGQGLIECSKTHFQEFDSFSWFRARTDRMLESSFSRVRFVFLVQGNDWSNVGKLIFKSSIRFLVQGNDWSNVGKLVFKSSISLLWFRATTDRMLESSFSRVRFVYFSRCPEHSKLIELLKTSFPTFDQSLPWTK